MPPQLSTPPASRQQALPPRRALDVIAEALRRAMPMLGDDEALDVAVAVIVAMRRSGVAR
ncbi:MAG: hypothetical protein ACRCT8_03255 [Lacipirellulaceae bacterium]